MGETMDIAGREGTGRGRPKDVTLLRIDHSDVYIENERLGEDLVHTIDHIHRRRYQKVMSRDTEINELKQSLLTMQQRTKSGAVGSKRSKDGSTSPRHEFSKFRHGSSTNKKTILRNGPNSNTTSNLQNKRKKMLGDSSTASTPSALRKSIEVRLPRTNHQVNNNKKDNGHKSDNDDDDNESDSNSDLNSSDDSDDDDDDDDDDDGDDDGRHDSVKGGNKNLRMNGFRNNNRPLSKMSRITSASTTSTRPHNNDNNNNNNTKNASNNNKNGQQIKRVDTLSLLMSRLNLDKLPPSWYTQVVPASDVHVTKRAIGIDGVKNLTQPPRSNSSKKSKLQRNRRKHIAADYVRPATSGGDIFSNRQEESKVQLLQRSNNNQGGGGRIPLQQKPRPFTTTGIRSRLGDESGVDLGKRTSSRMGAKSSMSKNGGDDRTTRTPQTVLFCEQQQSIHGTKTMRQLKEEEMQSVILDTPSPIDILLQEVREEQKVIDEKVKRFVKSLDEKKRSERLKKLMSETNLL